MGIAALNPSYELTRLAAKAPPTVIDVDQNIGVHQQAICGRGFSRDASAFRSGLHKSPKQRGLRIPSGGRVEVVWRGAFGMDAKRGVPGHGWPVTPTLGTAP